MFLANINTWEFTTLPRARHQVRPTVGIFYNATADEFQQVIVGHITTAIYSRKLNSWHNGPDLPDARDWAALAQVTNDYFYLIGGVYGRDGPYRSIWKFDGHWSDTNLTLNVPRDELARTCSLVRRVNVDDVLEMTI